MSQSYQNAFILQSFGLAGEDPNGIKRAWGEVQSEAGSSAPSASPRREYKQGCPPQVKYDEEGNETFEWAWYQSVERLRDSWEGIMERYSEAHYEDQDEIYLGRPNVPGDEMRVIRDRGSLRALENPSRLDLFMHQELPHYDYEDEDEVPIQPPEPPRRTIPHPAFDDNDEDLQEFLRQEARRREVLGDEEDDVVDLRAFDGEALAEEAEPPDPRRISPAAQPMPPSPSTGCTAAPEAGSQPTALDAFEAPRWLPRPSSPDANVAVELDIYRSVKREAVEQLLRSDTLGSAALPYDLVGLQTVLS